MSNQAGGQLLVDEPAPGVARLTISHTRKRGALDHAILDGIVEALGGLDARCVILTGSDGMFSAGYDIGDIPDDVFAEQAEKLVAHPFTAAIDALEAYPYPTLAALSGHAIGGGLELAVACDLRIAAPGIRLGMPPAKLGLVYSHTGLKRFMRAVGEPRTRELFLLGRNIDSAAAERWGLVNWVAEDGALAEEALAIAVEMAANAPLSLSGNKRALKTLIAHADALDADTERELVELRESCFASEDFREGVRSFGEKRAPNWRAR